MLLQYYVIIENYCYSVIPSWQTGEYKDQLWRMENNHTLKRLFLWHKFACQSRQDKATKWHRISCTLKISICFAWELIFLCDLHISFKSQALKKNCLANFFCQWKSTQWYRAAKGFAAIDENNTTFNQGKFLVWIRIDGLVCFGLI